MTLYQTKNAQLFLISVSCEQPVKRDPILDQFSMITRPYTRPNGLKTIPIANIWEYPPPGLELPIRYILGKLLWYKWKLFIYVVSKLEKKNCFCHEIRYLPPLGNIYHYPILYGYRSLGSGPNNKEHSNI